MFKTTCEIGVEDLVLHCILGVPESERAHPQKISVSFTIVPNTNASLESDSIRDAVDYAKVAERITSVAKSKSFRLVEHLGQMMGECIMREFPCMECSITIRKPNALTEAQHTFCMLTFTRE